VKRDILFYGRLRDAGLGDRVTMTFPEGVTARQALAALKAALGKRAPLLDGCVLATADAVLAPSDLLPRRGPVAALPPVCGG
jgi:hypothetical protein